METITPYAILRVFSGNGERLGNRGLATVEGRIKTDDLRQIRMRVVNRLDRREIVRLMQRRERDQRRKLLDDFTRYEDRCRIFGTAVNDPVSDRGDLRPIKPMRAHAHHRSCCRFVIHGRVSETLLDEEL